MAYMQRTPFRRSLSRAQLAPTIKASVPGTVPLTLNKWQPLRVLTTARKELGLNDRDLSVLQALIGCHGSDTIDARPDCAIIYASNKTLSHRLHGMPESTLRRHLAKLVSTGIIIRRDSPNGKRYIRRSETAVTAYGFDLAPLILRFHEFENLAARVLAEEDELKTLRETMMLMLRDLASLVDDGKASFPDLSVWPALEGALASARKAARRKPNRLALDKLTTDLEQRIGQCEAALHQKTAESLSASNRQNERHQQRKDKERFIENTDISDDEVAGKAGSVCEEPTSVTLEDVLVACPSLETFSQDEIRSWSEFVETMTYLAPMIGVQKSTWESARALMGPIFAGLTLAVLIERFDEIERPDAYLARLSQRFTAVNFNPVAFFTTYRRRRRSRN